MDSVKNNEYAKEVLSKLSEYKFKLEKFRDKHPTKSIWSISRLNTFETCPMQYNLIYNKKVKQEDNIYSVLGGVVHDLLENFYLGVISRQDMIIDFNKKFNENSHLKFPNDKIKNTWYKSISHFLLTHKKDNKIMLSEQLCVTVIDKEIFRGYIDMILFTDEGLEILDWKTSSKFNGKKLTEAGRQLLLYKTALEKQLGVKINKLKWNMLKYARVTYKTDSNRLSTKVESRDKILLMKNIKKIEDYVLEYKATEENISEMKEYFKRVISNIKELENQENKKYKCSAEEFFCNNLCGVKQFCPRFNRNKNIKEEDIIKEDII